MNQELAGALGAIIGTLLGIALILFYWILEGKPMRGSSIETKQSNKSKPPLPQPVVIQGYQPVGNVDLSNPPLGYRVDTLKIPIGNHGRFKIIDELVEDEKFPMQDGYQ